MYRSAEGAGEEEPSNKQRTRAWLRTSGVFPAGGESAAAKGYCVIKTGVPSEMRSNAAITSSFSSRMQPCEAGVPMRFSSFVP